jgi:GntR family transcriptional repressor for pyruvate dehydrogenase complex
VARRVLDAHKELASLIEMRDGAGARRLMDEHVKMIGARRVAEHRDKRQENHACC